MSSFAQVHHATGVVQTTVQLPASKSESNRALIIRALSNSQALLENLSPARDTQTMLRLLDSQEPILDVIDAGTTMRFLTAYFAVTNQQKILTGTQRMCQRPIGILTDALVELGADITFLGEKGFPPLKINGFHYSGKKELTVRGDISSQYISALLMIAPVLPEGLTIRLTGKVGSKPYIAMTLALMQHYGVKSTWQDNVIHIAAQTYQPTSYVVESDWSAASYWFSIAALAQEAEIQLQGLRKNSWQGDSVIAQLATHFGVKATFNETGVLLTKDNTNSATSQAIDFEDCPDLAQTYLVLAAAKKVNVTATGLESLYIKETDRVAALQAELKSFKAILEETKKGEVALNANNFEANEKVSITTYDDHRMAMAFAPLALLQPITIQHPEVVVKSYPDFWNDLRKAGFTVNLK